MDSGDASTLKPAPETAQLKPAAVNAPRFSTSTLSTAGRWTYDEPKSSSAWENLRSGAAISRSSPEQPTSEMSIAHEAISAFCALSERT